MVAISRLFLYKNDEINAKSSAEHGRYIGRFYSYAFSNTMFPQSKILEYPLSFMF